MIGTGDKMKRLLASYRDYPWEGISVFSVLLGLASVIGLYIFALICLLSPGEDGAEVSGAMTRAYQACMLAKELLGATVIPVLLCELLLIRTNCKCRKKPKK